MTTPREDAIAALRAAIDRALPESRDPANDEDVTISGYDFWCIRYALAALGAEAETPREDAIAERMRVIDAIARAPGWDRSAAADLIAQYEAALGAEAETLHLDFCSGGEFCSLDDCLCQCHVRPASWVDLASPETAEALARALTAAIVDIEEERLPTDCLVDECSHEDGEHPEPGVHCGDGKRLAAAILAAMRETGRQ